MSPKDVSPEANLAASLLKAGLCVKPLKWLNYRASSVLGLYQIVHDGAAFYVNSGDEYRMPGRFETSKDAADAAQSDFEARILSALSGASQ